LITERRWLLPTISEDEAAGLAQELGITAVTARLLLRRGVRTAGEARTFLRPSLSELHEPWSLPDIRPATERIIGAIREGARIVVYGDYDVDGISGTAILYLCLRMMGADVSYYIPDRCEEGYGLNRAAIEQLAGLGVALVVTVDCGISAVDEIRAAGELGVDVVVTDHHEPGPERPDAAAIVNAKLPGSVYPFQHLAGAGVAFKLAWALGKTLSEGRQLSQEFREFLLDSVSLAGLGTIADVVPLIGENRILARFGLSGLSHSKRAGLAALRRSARVEGQELSAFDVGFELAPRLNAAGRLGAADQAVELLITDDGERAEAIAAHLDAENSRRRTLQKRIVDEVRTLVLAEVSRERERKAIVLAGEGWHPGVIGIVASRIVDEFCRPTVLLACEGDVAHGSCRSIDGFDIHEGLSRCEALLTTYGGHAKAAGLRLPVASVPEFQRTFHRVADEAIDEEQLVPTLELDAEIALRDVSMALVREIGMLEPFGEQNREPLLCSRSLGVVGSTKRMGTGGKHLSFWVRQGDFTFRAVAFGMGELEEAIVRAGRCSLAFRPVLNSWRGTDSIELMVQDIRLEG